MKIKVVGHGSFIHALFYVYTLFILINIVETIFPLHRIVVLSDQEI